MLRCMLWRAAVVVIGGGYLVYRVTLWREIRAARRSGDRERERWLRGRGSRLVRWAAVCLAVVLVVLSVLVWRNGG